MSTVALAHHWLVSYRGGERVLSEFIDLFPSASISTLVCDPKFLPPEIVSRVKFMSFLQSIPVARRFYKQFLVLHPFAFSRLRVPSGTSLILSSDASIVKGLRKPPGAKQVCYCHSPPRYLWGMQEEYIKHSGYLGALGGAVFRSIVPYVRSADKRSADNVDSFIANSNFVRQRIRRCYNRDSTVIFPPVSVEDFESDRPFSDSYLVVSQLVPYKRVDIAVEAFNIMAKPLVVIGEGSELERLRRMAGPTVQVLGKQPFSIVKKHFETCRAFINPQIEDFGIAAVEAQASGRPVIAYRAGGACETVIEGVTGVFFDEQTSDSLINSVRNFETIDVSRFVSCRGNSERFNRDRFKTEIMAFLKANYSSELGF